MKEARSVSNHAPARRASASKPRWYWVSLAILLLGIPIGPILVTNFSLASGITPSHRMGFVMTLLSAAITLGTSAGNSIAGRLKDARGHHLALAATLSASVVVLACASLYSALNKQKQP